MQLILMQREDMMSHHSKNLYCSNIQDVLIMKLQWAYVVIKTIPHLSCQSCLLCRISLHVCVLSFHKFSVCESHTHNSLYF